MTVDISGFGLVVTVIASRTFPTGITITEFADDANPIDFASIQIADAAMGLNGDLITWSRATPLPAVLSVIPGSIGDIALQTIANNNRVSKGKSNALDIITMNVTYPDGSSVTLTGGKMTEAMFGRGVSSQGRQQTKVYTFSFESKIGA